MTDEAIFKINESPKKRSSNISLFLLWVMITSAFPFVFIMLPYHPHKYLIGVCLFVMLLLVLYKKNFAIGNSNVVMILYIQAIFCIFAFYYFGHDEYLALIFHFVSYFVVVLFVSTFVDEYIFAKSFIVITIFIGLLGAFAFILIATGLLEPYSFFDNPDGRVSHNYILTFSNMVRYHGGTPIARIGGYFDEPGTFASIIIIALLINKLYINNKNYELLLILSGLFTLSILYYLSILVYLIVFYFKRRYISTMSKYSIILITVFSFIYYNPFDSPSIEQINLMSVGRLFGVEGSEDPLVDNQRVFLTMISYNAFIDKPLLGNGMGYRSDPNSNYSNQYLGSNPLSSFAVHGIIGSMVLYLHVIFFIYLSIKKSRNRLYLRSALVLLFVFLDRPIGLGLLFFLLIYLLVKATERPEPDSLPNPKVSGHYRVGA